MAHLCVRPLDQRNPPDAPRFADDRRYLLDRETVIQRVVWTQDGWLRLTNGTSLPEEAVQVPALPPCPWCEVPARDDFDAPALDLRWQVLRVPLTELCAC